MASSASPTLRIAAEASAVVGDTPMVALKRIGEGLGAELVGKLEWFNPGGSIKDRIGVAMIGAAEADG
jgi:cysteine synthase A